LENVFPNTWQAGESRKRAPDFLAMGTVVNEEPSTKLN